MFRVISLVSASGSSSMAFFVVVAVEGNSIPYTYTLHELTISLSEKEGER